MCEVYDHLFPPAKSIGIAEIKSTIKNIYLHFSWELQWIRDGWVWTYFKLHTLNF